MTLTKQQPRKTKQVLGSKRKKFFHNQKESNFAKKTTNFESLGFGGWGDHSEACYHHSAKGGFHLSTPWMFPSGSKSERWESQGTYGEKKKKWGVEGLTIQGELELLWGGCNDLCHMEQSNTPKSGVGGPSKILPNNMPQ